MNLEYKEENETLLVKQDGEVPIERDQNYRFIFFCTEINQCSQNSDQIPKLLELIQEFADFLRRFGRNTNFPLEFIQENNIPFLCNEILKSGELYNAFFPTISLILDLFYTCEGATSLFSEDEFLDTIISNFKNISGPLRNSYIRVLTDIISKEDVSKRDLILEKFPLDYLISLMKNPTDINFINDCLNYIFAILQHPVPKESEILYLILKISNQFLSNFPIQCLKIHIQLINHHEIFDGFDCQQVNSFLDIDNNPDQRNASEYATLACKFITTLLKHNQQLQGCFPNDLLFKIALTSSYDEDLRYFALLALRSTDHYGMFIQNMISLFDQFSQKCKQIAGSMILDYANKVSVDNVSQLITPENNLFTIVHNLFELHSFPLMKNGYLAMAHFFDVTNSDDNTIQLFLEEFPDDTIWTYSQTDNEEINQIAEKFISEYLSVDDSE